INPATTVRLRCSSFIMADWITAVVHLMHWMPRRIQQTARSARLWCATNTASHSNLTVVVTTYIVLQYMASPVPDRELKKGSAELMILSLLENRPRHGYEMTKFNEMSPRGAIRLNATSLEHAL